MRTEPASSGYTLVELVTVIAIIGVISVFVAAQFTGGGVQSRAFYDQLLSQFGYARKAAIGQRRAVCVHVTATDSTLYYADAAGTACPKSSAVPGPGSPAYALSVPGGVTVAAATFMFDGLGRYRTSGGAAPGADLVVTLAATDSYAITVDRETGYAY